ncbi:hypothetical protein FA15DRAFT_701912 [Coprinopsis marcescibilis]|uniref:Uncharacterized protein n=1 Tax=Coprinopsis marcescibilis TaxID=230819 RepID=A0A5C3L4B0_COPMA|nr:hypothetical protein FA15DRAFT_701912 [Coprinopsis marcescibilis]
MPPRPTHNSTQVYGNGSVESTILFEDPVPVAAPGRQNWARNQVRRVPNLTPVQDVAPPAVLLPETDTPNNPFVNEAMPGESQSCLSTTNPTSVWACLQAVAAPALQRPQAGPHSPPAPLSPSLSPSGMETTTGAREGQNRKSADDIWKFFPKGPPPAWYECVFCKWLEDASLEAPTIGDYSCNTGTSTMHQDLIAHHQDKWIPACLKMGLSLTSVKAKIALRQYCEVHGHASLDPAEDMIPVFSSEAFIDAIVEFIAADDQAINVVESPFLCCIFCILRQDL